MVLLTREQIEARLVALHQASLELVGDLSIETLLERIVELARQQAGARYAALGVLNDQGELEKFIPVGMTTEEIRHIAHPPIGKGLIGAIQRERRTIRIADIPSDSRSLGFPSHHPPMRSFLGVPILLGGRLLGQIYLTDKEDFPEFTADDEHVIETLAAYAAVAISNARLYQDLLQRDRLITQRNTDLALLNDISSVLASALDLEQALDRALSRLMGYLEVEAGEIFLKDEDQEGLLQVLHRGEAAQAFWTREHFKVGEGFIGIVAESGKPLVSTSLQYDVRFLRKAVVEAGFRSIGCIPLTAHDQVVGVMSLASRGEFHIGSRELNLLLAIGAMIGITVENMRLNQQARRLAVLEERERIGMDLHDGIIQSIYGVGLALDYARMSIDEDPGQARVKIEQAIQGLNTTIHDIRSYILDLRPRQFHGENLVEGLELLIEEFHANTGIDVTLTGPEDGRLVVPPSQATALFLICQEALSNVAKYAQANHTTIDLWIAPGRVLLEVADDGQGFDLRKMNVTLGHGLANMHTRARKVGGDLEITSEPGKGTNVLAWVPIRRNVDAHKSKQSED